MTSSANKFTQSFGDGERSFQAIMEATVDAIIIIDSSGEIQLINRATEKLFLYKSEELFNNNVSMLMPDPFRSEHDSYIKNYLKSGNPKIIGIGRQVTGQRKDGTTFPMHLSVGEFQKNENQFFVGIIHDLTERKQVEEALQHAQKMESMGQLTGGIAHDFNNLLTIIIGNLELLDMKLDDNKHKELLTEAQEAADLGARLIERLLAFSRKGQLEPTIVNANELIVDLTELLHRTLGEHVDVSTVLDNNLWKISADPTQLESAIVNLSVNARDAMPDGGQLILETRNTTLDSTIQGLEAEVIPGDYVQLSVTDTGTGMPKSVKVQALEPFFTTKETGRGTGLGLSMVYGFMKQSEGFITIYSEESVGTTINLYFPRAEKHEIHKSTKMTEARASLNNNETILVVEDDNRVRRLVLTQLKDLGYKVLEATNAHEALNIVEKDNSIDLIFTDLVMPGGMSGIELGQEIQNSFPDKKVLLTSGYAEELVNPDKISNLNLNILRKPYRRSELSQAIRESLDSN